MAKPRAIVLAGYGTSSEQETMCAFEKAGAYAGIAHLNDIIENPSKLENSQIIAIPGGLYLADGTGSGNVMSLKIKNNLGLDKFIEGDKLVIGIGNGFNVLAGLGLVPALNNNYGIRQAALCHNETALYINRWTDIEMQGKSPWAAGIGKISMPIGHSEARFYAEKEIIDEMKNKGLIAARYCKGEICSYLGLEANPCGSLDDIAGITDESGKILGIMPRPERAVFFTQRPDWPYLKEHLRRSGKEIPQESDGIKIFRNGVDYFR